MAKEEEQFIVDTIPKLESQLKSLEEPIFWTIAHHRRRSVKQMAGARSQREKQKDDVKKALLTLRGDGNIEVTFIRDKDGNISGFKT